MVGFRAIRSNSGSSQPGDLQNYIENQPNVTEYCLYRFQIPGEKGEKKKKIGAVKRVI